MASKTPGWVLTAASTSSGKIFSPPELIDADPRPWTVMVPSDSTEARSPGTDHRIPVGVHREGGLGLGRVLVVADRDPPGAGQPADPPVPGGEGPQIVVEHRGVLAHHEPRPGGPVLDRPVGPALARPEPVHDHDVGKLLASVRP